MLNNRKIAVVMPAYNAAATLARTFAELDPNVVDEVVLVDDASKDSTFELARELGLDPISHERNLGYGGNQKTCYGRALELEADVVVMVHPDYQYSPKLVPAMPFDRNSNNFVFDNQMIAQAVAAGARIGELSCPTRYFDEASSINLRNSIQYGLGVLRTCVQYRLQRSGLRHYPYLEVRPLAAPAATPAAAKAPVARVPVQ